MGNIVRNLESPKKSGFVYLNAPSNGHVHRHPDDAFRFYPDSSLSMVSVLRKSYSPNDRLQESFTVDQSAGEPWNDFVCIISGGAKALSGEFETRIWHSENCTNIYNGEEFLTQSYSEKTQDGRLLTILSEERSRARALERELIQIQQSVSWKATLPIRKLLPILRDGMKKLKG